MARKSTAPPPVDVPVSPPEPSPADPLDKRDPFDDSAAAVPAESLSENVLGTIRGLWAAGEELAALRTYRDAVRPEPSLDATADAVRAIVAAAPAPETWTRPAAPVTPDGASGGEVIPVSFTAEPRPPADPDAPRLTVVSTPPEAPKTGVHVLETKSVDHAFVLDPEEFGEHAHRLAVLQDEITALKSDHAAKKKAMKAAEARLEEERAREALIVRDRREVRSVQVEVVADYDAGVTRHIVVGTGLVIRERGLDGKELQVPLFGRLNVAEPPPAEDWSEGAPATDGGETDEEEDGDDTLDE